jgi:hypothetical protein
MSGQLPDELLPHHAGGPKHADVDSLRLHDVLSKKKPAALLCEGRRVM